MSELNDKSKKFWKNVSTRGRFVSFTDGVPVEVRISDWNMQEVDSDWGKKPAIRTHDGRYLKLESNRLKFELSIFVGKDVTLSITRNDSEPNARNTWYLVEEINPKK